MGELVAITGASGLLGANLTLEFAARGNDVLAIYGSHGIHVSGVEAISCDLTEQSTVRSLLRARRPRLIVHCAAATNVDWCQEHPDKAMHLNATVSGTLAELAATLQSRFVYISTDSVFDGSKGGYREEDPVSPINEYGRSKAAGERAVLTALPTALVLRVNLYGWNMQNKFSLAEWILRRLEQGEVVPGFIDTHFAPVLANDLARWIALLAESDSRGVFHIAASNYCSKYDFACAIAEVFALDSALVHRSLASESALVAPRPRSTWLRADRFVATLGETPPSILDGLYGFHRLREVNFLSRLKAAGETSKEQSQ